MQYCLSDEPEVRDLDLKEASDTNYPITTYQPIYFLASSFEDAKKKMGLVIIMSNIHVCTKCCHYSEWGSTIKKPFHLQYMPCYESVRVLALDKEERKKQIAAGIEADKAELEAMETN